MNRCGALRPSTSHARTGAHAGRRWPRRWWRSTTTLSSASARTATPAARGSRPTFRRCSGCTPPARYPSCRNARCPHAIRTSTTASPAASVRRSTPSPAICPRPRPRCSNGARARATSDGGWHTPTACQSPRSRSTPSCAPRRSAWPRAATRISACSAPTRSTPHRAPTCATMPCSHCTPAASCIAAWCAMPTATARTPIASPPAATTSAPVGPTGRSVGRRSLRSTRRRCAWQ